MDDVTVRELRAQPAKVWEKVAAGEAIVLTRNGKQFAIISPTQPSDVESNLRALRAAKFGRLLEQQHARSVALGLDKMTLKDINAEIAMARREKAARNAGGR